MAEVHDLEPQREVKELLVQHVVRLAGLGWHVVLKDRSCGLHSYFKNGKPRKSPEISIQHSDRIDIEWDDETEDMVERRVPQVRPWVVSSPGLRQSKSFSDVHDAIALFLSQARDCAPSSSTPSQHEQPRPIVDDVKARIQTAATAGEIVTVVYHGGSQPGSQRELAPISVSGSTFTATVIATGSERTFRFDRTEIVEGVSSAPLFDATKVRPDSSLPPPSLKNIAKPHLRALEGIQCEIHLTDRELRLVVPISRSSSRINNFGTMSVELSEEIALKYKGTGGTRWLLVVPGGNQRVADQELPSAMVILRHEAFRIAKIVDTGTVDDEPKSLHGRKVLLWLAVGAALVILNWAMSSRVSQP